MNLQQPNDTESEWLEERLDQLKSRVKRHWESDRFDCVLELLVPYLARRPTDGYMWFVYGNSLRLVGRLDEARGALLRAWKLAPEDYRGWVAGQLGMLYSNWRNRM